MVIAHQIHRIIRFFAGLLFSRNLFLLMWGLNTAPAQSQHAEPVWYGWAIVNTYPHDSNAFTQGLLFHNGYLYESTGRRGQSDIRKTELETGAVLQKTELDSVFFGEGLAMWQHQLIQITLSSETAFYYDVHSLEKTRAGNFKGAGWGLTTLNEQLILSNGSDTLRFFDPKTFRETHHIVVTDSGVPVDKLNELETVKDKIFANVLFSDQIVIINPENGNVTGRIDLSRLVEHAERNGKLNVLNGIAYDSEQHRLFVTGKLWPELYEIKITPLE